MKKILVIDNYDSFVYNLIQLLRESKMCSFDIVHNNQINFSTLFHYDGLLLSPGPGIPSEAGNLLPLIQQCQNSHAILGVCLGHQAIAENFGAKLVQLPYPKHGHRSPLHMLNPHDTLYQNIVQPAYVGRYHSWVVYPPSIPEELQVSTLDEDGNIMSFYHKTYPIHGVQYHPESIITNFGRELIQNWLREVPSSLRYK